MKIQKVENAKKKTRKRMKKKPKSQNNTKDKNILAMW